MNRYLFTAPEVLPSVEAELLSVVRSCFRRRRDPRQRADLRHFLDRLHELREVKAAHLDRAAARTHGGDAS